MYCSYQDTCHLLSAQELHTLGSHKLYQGDNQFQVTVEHTIQSLLTSRFDLYPTRHSPKIKQLYLHENYIW